MCVCVYVCVHVCVYNIASTHVKGLGMKVGCVHFIKHPTLLYNGSGLGTSLVSKAVVCWESNTVTAGSGCDSVDAISTMWTHTGYAPYLVTWQRFVHSTGYLLQHIIYNVM